jgi:hypothetical protein
MREMKRQFGLVCLLAISCLAGGQQLPHLAMLTPEATLPTPVYVPAPIKPAAPAQPCAIFVEPFDIDDYSGPMNKVVARFSQRVDSATVQLPRHHSPRPCAMDAHDKFNLFVQNTADPLNFMGAAWDAGMAHMDHDDATYRQGVAGYGKRYSAALTDNVAGDFFSTFLYPSLFHQDPRYYRMGQGQGTPNQRLAHALAHRFVARSDSGKRMFNYSEWLGTVSSKALSNVYHPGNPRGFAPTASRVGFSVANDMAWDVLREFWPEIARKFRLPFRTHEPVAVKAPVPMPFREPIRQATPGYPAAADQPVLEASR